jgi:hypothetical protein
MHARRSGLDPGVGRLHTLEGETIMAQAISITEGKFVYNSIGYFRNNADNVVLGTWGKKKSPLGGPHYVQDEGRIPAQHMKVRKATSVTIDFSQTSQTDIGATILVPGVGKLGPAALLERGRDGQLALVKLEVANLVEAINTSPAALEGLCNSDEPRVVGGIWVVVSAEIGRTISNSGSLSLAGMVNGVAVKGDVKSGASSEVICQIEPGSTFAYMLFEPKWAENMKRNRTKVIRCEDDLKGMN